MGWKASVLDMARRMGALAPIGALFGRDRLTVLGYHRIAEPGTAAGFRGNVSAGPAAFAEQLDWIAGRFNVVSLDDVLGWLDGGTRLPPRPVLITFDDGYRDNLDVAAPLLAERSMPATLFLTTGPTDGGPALYWDLAAWHFDHATVDAADLPVLGHRSWDSQQDRDLAAHDFVFATKRMHPDDRNRCLEDLAPALGSAAGDRIPGLYLDWDAVRALDGWTIGPHTVDHPVLSALSEDEAVRQIAESARRIEEETGSVAPALAYPNGLTGDFDPRTAGLAGMRAAFSLVPGPARSREALGRPFEIRRVYVGAGDSLGVFAAKVAGVSRLLGGRS